ncbi:MAG: VWA domain-containing protein [Pseudomonadota bacterium]|nr:VWA domain-containing protein [Pseudomonadota bacterium]
MNDPALLAAWEAAWPRALAAWSPYIQLRPPRFLAHPAKEGEPGMDGQIAAIRMRDLTVLVNTTVVRERGLAHLALPVLAHEIGHHVHVPGSLTDNARLLAAMVRMLEGLPESAPPMVANLYADLLVNDRLQRRGGVDIAAVYRALRDPTGSRVWGLYTRAYEHLWRLPAGSLAPDGIDAPTDGDALLVARIVRAFAGDWLRGARRFASVVYPYVLADQEEQAGKPSFATKGLLDTRDAGQGEIPDGLADLDDAEGDDDGFEDDYGRVEPTAGRSDGASGPSGGGQARAPYTYADLLRRLGVLADATQVTARYYRERALPHLLPFPTRRAPRVMEPLAEGYEMWEAGDALEDLDVLGSMMVSPVPIPGITTVRRVYGETPGSAPARRPVDLDLYVDCSGSMPDPARDLSWLALAGVILALSALRTGGRVQATLWSGAGQTARTDGFVTDETAILDVVCGYISGGTSFPLPLLRQTWEDRPADAPAAHIVVISDDGVDTMLEDDERGVPGAEVAAMALARARGGGTLVLNLSDVERYQPAPTLRALGWRLHAVTRWEDLLVFARAFVRETFDAS